MSFEIIKDNFSMIEKCLSAIYDAAECDGTDRISYYINVASDHLTLIKRQKEDVAVVTAQDINRLLRLIEDYRAFIERLASMDNVDTSTFAPYSMGYAVATNEIRTKCQEILKKLTA